MHRTIGFNPASIDIKPDTNKYYGVTLREPGNLNILGSSRAFIASWSGYPNPTSYVVIVAEKMTAGNTWDKIMDKNDKHERSALEDFIIFLYREGFKVIEFDTAKELFTWLAEIENRAP